MSYMFVMEKRGVRYGDQVRIQAYLMIYKYMYRPNSWNRDVACIASNYLPDNMLNGQTNVLNQQTNMLNQQTNMLNQQTKLVC